MENRIREIQEFQRKGATQFELCQFILQSPNYCQAWSYFQPNGKTQIKNWKKVMACISQLKNLKSSPNWEEIEALKEIGEDAKIAVPYLIPHLKTKSIRGITTILMTFEKMGKGILEDPSILSPFIKHSDIYVQRSAVRVLGCLFEDSHKEIPDLQTMLNNPYDYTQIDACLALYRIKKLSQKPLEILIKILKKEKPWISGYVAQALSEMKEEAYPALDYLIPNLSNSQVHVRSCVCEAIGTIGPKAKKAIPDLLKVIENSTSYDRVFAAKAIKNIGIGIEKAVSLLSNSLETLKPEDKRDTIDAIGVMGKEAKSALLDLKKALNSAENQRFRKEIKKAIRLIKESK